MSTLEGILEMPGNRRDDGIQPYYSSLLGLTGVVKMLCYLLTNAGYAREVHSKWRRLQSTSLGSIYYLNTVLAKPCTRKYLHDSYQYFIAVAIAIWIVSGHEQPERWKAFADIESESVSFLNHFAQHYDTQRQVVVAVSSCYAMVIISASHRQESSFIVAFLFLCFNHFFLRIEPRDGFFKQSPKMFPEFPPLLR